jgi:hypothetical protein
VLGQAADAAEPPWRRWFNTRDVLDLLTAVTNPPRVSTTLSDTDCPPLFPPDGDPPGLDLPQCGAGAGPTAVEEQRAQLDSVR